MRGRGMRPSLCRLDRGAASSYGQHLVSYQMQTDILRFWPIKKEGIYCFANVGAKLIPCISLGEDAFAESLGGIASIGFLKDFKDKFPHAVTLAKQQSNMKRQVLARLFSLAASLLLV